MNKPITLCDRCEHNGSCCLSYDGQACRDIRTVTPTEADVLRQLSNEELADLIYNELAMFPNKDSLLAYLNEEVKDNE